MHKIILHRNAVKFYRKAGNALKERVSDAMEVIAGIRTWTDISRS
jgi:hypothetical protein